MSGVIDSGGGIDMSNPCLLVEAWLPTAETGVSWLIF